MTLGQVIRQRRIELALTQEELAERVGENVRQSEISRLERDYVGLPRRSRLEALARALDLSLGQLLMRSGWVESESMVDERHDPALATPTAPSPATREDGSDEGELAYPALPHFDEGSEESWQLLEALARAREVSQHTDEVLKESAHVLDAIRRRRRSKS